MQKLSNKAFRRNAKDPTGTIRLTVKTEDKIVKVLRETTKKIFNLINVFMSNEDNIENIVLLAVTLGESFMEIMGQTVQKAYKRGVETAQQEMDRIDNVPKTSTKLTKKDIDIIRTIKNTDFSLINTLSQRHIAQAKAIFVDGMHNGLSQYQIVDNLITRLNTTEYQARRIVRTEITRTSNTASRKRYLASGMKYWQWNTAIDERVCPTCAPLDGKSIKIGIPFNKFLSAQGQKKNRGKILYQPPAHPMCRCGVSPSFNESRIRRKPAEVKAVPKPKMEGFTRAQQISIKGALKHIPSSVKSKVKTLKGGYSIIKTKGRITDDPRVKAEIPSAILMKYKTATGFYVGGDVNKIFVSKGTGSMEVLHEVGHAIYDEYMITRPLLKKKWIELHDEHLKSGHFITPRCSVNQDEHFADSFRFYLLKPNVLKYKYPEIYEFFRKNVFFGNELNNIITL